MRNSEVNSELGSRNSQLGTRTSDLLLSDEDYCMIVTMTIQFRLESPRDINWEKVFDLGGNESVESYIEELTIPVDW